MKRRRFLTIVLATAMLVGGTAIADDGEMTNKRMTHGDNMVTTFEQGIVNEILPEAEHAFTDMMGLYVPAQKASGAPAGTDETDPDGYIQYHNIDGVLVEELPVAKPLVNVFVFGPSVAVPNTAFGHSFMDTYAAVSLDDGLTWKKTNLSQSADKSSFNLEEDHKDSGPGSGKDPLPGDHKIELGGVMHPKGYDTPYTAHCSECHGRGLTGVAQVPSCYDCHRNKWEEEVPVEIGPIVYRVEVPTGKKQGRKKNSHLKIRGENAVDTPEVTIFNSITGDPIGTTKGKRNGGFKLNKNFKSTLPPCVVYAEYTDEEGKTYSGPSKQVVNKQTGEPIEDCEGSPVNLTEYPGGTYNVFQATVGNKTLVAWPSRFCRTGQPAYTMTTTKDDEEEDTTRLDAVVSFLQNGGTDYPALGVPNLPDFNMDDDLYLVDAFGVAGSQGSVDFTDESYPQAGIVPFGCVWTSRGVLLPGDDPRTADNVEKTHMVWTKAERLTSGRRDVNRIEVHGVKGAGFVVTWQEDPQGLRPGQGLGPGEGWSGAVAHPRTDAWYSFINEEYFDIVETVDNTTVPINILDHNLDTETEGSGRPQVFVPMAVPMRLSNNNKCNPADPAVLPEDDTRPLYCTETATDYHLKNQCIDTVTIQTGNENNPSESEMCVADSDGNGEADLPNRANTALTRPRTSLQGYDSDDDDAFDSAWVIVVAEESKGLGKFSFEPDGLLNEVFDGFADPCEADSTPTCTQEIGKNQWYFSFDMGTPDTSAGSIYRNSLVNNLVSQGNMLNQAEVYYATGELVGLMSTEDMGDYSGEGFDYNFDIVNTEIARRGSLLVQSIAKAQSSSSGLVAISSWKQGPMRQGGPADTMLRRFVIPTNYPDDIEHNPYAFENMECDWDGDGVKNWLILPGDNPYYPGGLCADPATNLSGVIPDTCIDDENGGDTPCPTVDFTNSTYGIGSTNPILQGFIQGEGNKTRVLTWHQCPSDYSVAGGDFAPVDCDAEGTDNNNLDDQSWYNPLDISKGHRGFLDGDFVMFLYAWSPNWRLNAKGHDRYDLYVRRSFDGGVNWSTTPSGGTASDGLAFGGDGTVTCESYRSSETGSGGGGEPKICFDFEAGVAEHARNITQHKSMRITTLDPRYARTKATIEEGCTEGLFVDTTVIPDFDSTFTCDDTSVLQDTDTRNPSRYFMVFETGDNRTVEVGEAEPLDLFFSRAESFGDDYVVWTETDSDSADATVCFPSDPHDVLDISDVIIGSGFCNEFDNLNTGGDTHSSEASLEANPDGSKMYGTWTQWVFDDNGEDVIDADAMARRVWWIDDYISQDNSYTLSGTGGN